MRASAHFLVCAGVRAFGFARGGAAWLRGCAWAARGSRRAARCFGCPAAAFRDGSGLLGSAAFATFDGAAVASRLRFGARSALIVAGAGARVGAGAAAGGGRGVSPAGAPGGGGGAIEARAAAARDVVALGGGAPGVAAGGRA